MDKNSIICTELYRQGFMDKMTYEADAEFGRSIIENYPEIMIGYQYLARPIVEGMQKSRRFTELVNLFAEPWSREMSFQMGKRGKGDSRGAFIMFFSAPLCAMVGNIILGRFQFFIFAGMCLLLLNVSVFYYLKRAARKRKN